METYRLHAHGVYTAEQWTYKTGLPVSWYRKGEATERGIKNLLTRRGIDHAEYIEYCDILEQDIFDGKGAIMDMAACNPFNIEID